MVNLNMINISSVNFCTWQHLENHWNESQLQHLVNIPSVPVGQLYCHMARGFENITPFSPENSTGDTDSIWTLYLHTGVYVMAIGSLIPEGLGIFCCYFLVLTCQISMLTFNTRYHAIYFCGWWCRGSTIYRCDGKTSQPIRPHENYGLHMEHVPTWMESWCKQKMQSLVVPAQGSLASMTKIQGTQKCT